MRKVASLAVLTVVVIAAFAGVVSLGFSTMLLPAAIAGANFHTAIIIG